MGALFLLACTESTPAPPAPGSARPPGSSASVATSSASSQTSASSSSSAPKAVVGPRCPPAPATKQPFKHSRSKLVIAQGAPLHGVVDPIVNPGQKLELIGKFSYGPLSKDLEDEKVVAYLQATTGCGKWEAIGKALTDDDGQVSFEVPPKMLAKAGRHRFELVVLGDLSRATGSIWVLEKKHKVVVFDIDGTLSSGDDQLVEKLLAGHEVKMHPGGPEVVRAHHELGRQVIYITGRPQILAAMTRAWLDRKGFVSGPVITTESVSQSSPTKDGVQKYKRDKLEGLIKNAELDFIAAYGNAETDICAYAQAGIAPAKTFIIGANGGKACPGFASSQALQDGYPPHLPTVR